MVLQKKKIHVILNHLVFIILRPFFKIISVDILILITTILQTTMIDPIYSKPIIVQDRPIILGSR